MTSRPKKKGVGVLLFSCGNVLPCGPITQETAQIFFAHLHYAMQGVSRDRPTPTT